MSRPIDEQATEPHDEREAEQHDRRLDDATAGVSAWGISLVVHAVALLLLITVVFVRHLPEKVPVRVVAIDVPAPIEPDAPKRDLEQKTVPELDVPEEVEVALVTDLELEVEPIETENESAVTAEAKARPEAVSSHETGSVGAFMAIGFGGGGAGMFGPDGPGGRRRSVGKLGGTQASEDAVERALRWFTRHQSPGGQWDVDGYGQNCDGDGQRCEPGTEHTGRDGDVACTGYAILCYLGAGYDHRTPNRYRKVVGTAIDWLLGMQAADGSLGRRNYEHAVAAMALIEAYGMTLDHRLREPCQRAVDVILARQSKGPDGYPLGWDYTAPNASRQDSSVTGWNVMALKSAKVAGLDVGQGLAGAKRWLEGAWKAANPDWKGIGYQDESKFPYTWNALTGETRHDSRVPMGAVSAVFLGGRQGDPMLESMGNYIVAHQLPTTYPCNTYYLYYNTMAIFQLGGERFATWNQPVRDMLVDSQRREGCFDGSWDWEGTQFHGHRTGRLLSTAYNTLSLEVYYRKARLLR